MQVLQCEQGVVEINVTSVWPIERFIRNTCNEGTIITAILTSSTAHVLCLHICLHHYQIQWGKKFAIVKLAYRNNFENERENKKNSDFVPQVHILPGLHWSNRTGGECYNTRQIVRNSNFEYKNVSKTNKGCEVKRNHYSS